MKPSQTIFNKTEGTVTISLEKYNKLIHRSDKLEDYKELCREMSEILRGDSQ